MRKRKFLSILVALFVVALPAMAVFTGMDLDATLYYIDKPSLSYPFRVYGTKKRLFVTSPLIDNEELFFDLSGMMEFAVKALNTLNMPLPYCLMAI